jgi:hypothetical protein
VLQLSQRNAGFSHLGPSGPESSSVLRGPLMGTREAEILSGPHSLLSASKGAQCKEEHVYRGIQDQGKTLIRDTSSLT